MVEGVAGSSGGDFMFDVVELIEEARVELGQHDIKRGDT